MAVNGHRLRFRDEFRAGLEEGLENCFLIMEVVMNNIHQQRILHQIADEFVRDRTGLVHRSPLLAEFISLVFPRHEANSFNNGGLDDFFTGEDAPCHGVGTIRVGIGAEVTLFVDHVISDIGIVLDVGDEKVEEAWGDEEFKVCLVYAHQSWTSVSWSGSQTFW